SQSSTATIEDFIEPFQYTLRVGPSADAGPDQAVCQDGTGVMDFPLSGAVFAGLSPIITNFWSVVSGSVNLDDFSSLITTAHVASAQATLRLTVISSNGCTETDDIVLSAKPNPSCAITGGQSVTCPLTTLSFQGPPGMDGYSWSVTGNGSISGGSNESTVSVL